MANAERSVTLYQGSPLEVIGTRALVFSEVHQKESRFFIPEDIVVSQYGIVGFLLVDNKPEQRWTTYTNPEWIGTEIHETYPGEYENNRSHFIDTDRGFKIIRYFLLPSAVSEFFERDRFLGEPLIDKCCREGTLPREFDETRATTQYAFGIGGITEGAREIVMAVVKASQPDLTDKELRTYEYGKDQYPYVSFHPWQDFKFVVGEGQRSIFTAMYNFDGVIARFDTNKILTTRELLPNTPNNPSLEIGS